MALKKAHKQIKIKRAFVGYNFLAGLFCANDHNLHLDFRTYHGATGDKKPEFELDIAIEMRNRGGTPGLPPDVMSFSE